MRILGLDVGEKRIGVAVSDPLGITAQGLPVIQRRRLKEDLAAIKAICDERHVNEIIVGLPLHLSGRVGQKAKEVLGLVARLQSVLAIPIKTWDERLSTLEAQIPLLAAGVSRRKYRSVIDTLSAQVILQSYLNAQRR
jgi:putative Holliday junction resolvase